jgi:hypothetical protein
MAGPDRAGRLVAPAGYWFCLGASGQWHLIAAVVVPPDGPVRAQTACELWPSLVLDLAWREVASAIPLEDGRDLCPRCAGRLRATRERDRLVAPPATQPRLL